MNEEPTNARKSFGDIAPHLAEITDKVLFGDVWANTALSPRDRSLVTITSLISLYRVNELPFHLKQGAGERRDAGRDHRGHHPSRLLCGLAAGDDGAADRPQGVRTSRAMSAGAAARDRNPKGKIEMTGMSPTRLFL